MACVLLTALLVPSALALSFYVSEEKHDSTGNQKDQLYVTSWIWDGGILQFIFQFTPFLWCY